MTDQPPKDSSDSDPGPQTGTSQSHEVYVSSTQN